MSLITRALSSTDFQQCVDLDKKWFGENAATAEDLRQYIGSDFNHTIAVFDENILQGFATFEVLEDILPTDYIGSIIASGKVLFIQQFTTVKNYEIGNFVIDAVLLSAVEQKALELDCSEVWEALAVDHPFSRVQNPRFDAFGFYTSRGYKNDTDAKMAWQPNQKITIACYLFRKKVHH